NAAQPEHIVIAVQGALRRRRDARRDPIDRHLSIHVVHDENAAGQLARVLQPPVYFQVHVVEVGLGNAGEAHRVVIGEQHLEALPAVVVSGDLLAAVEGYQPTAVTQNAGGLGGGVALDAAPLALGD